MGNPVSLLGQARAFARDYPRDQMPSGFLWDTLDFVPAVVDAPLTGRGKWKWASVDLDSMAWGGILMPYRSGDQLLACTSDRLYQINEDTQAVTDRGATYLSPQNPIKYLDLAVQFDQARVQPPQLWPSSGALVWANAAHKFSPVGCTYKSMLVTAGAPNEEWVVRFSRPNTDLTDVNSFVANSFYPVSLPVTALAPLRSMILVFHKGSIERIRGSIPAHDDVEQGDMFVENFVDNAGTKHPRSIAYYNDSVIFADEHGVHLTDGAVLRNLTSLGGIQSYWRMLYQDAQSVVGAVYVNYYIVTLRHDPLRPPIPEFTKADELLPGMLEAMALEAPIVQPLADRPPVPPLPPDLPPIRPPVPDPPATTYNTTLVCDLDKRQWFRISNVNAASMWSGGGTSGAERIWVGQSGYSKVARIGPMFYPDETNIQTDDNGVVVKPRLETAWYRLGLEGRKRVRFAYLSYDFRGAGTNLNPVRVGYATSPESRVYTDTGALPSTQGYSRYRLPVYDFPYGISFYVEGLGEATAMRIYDLAVEASIVERSRI